MSTEVLVIVGMVIAVIVLVMLWERIDRIETRKRKERIRAEQVAFMRKNDGRRAPNYYKNVIITDAEWDEWYQEAMNQPAPPIPNRPSLREKETESYRGNIPPPPPPKFPLSPDYAGRQYESVSCRRETEMVSQTSDDWRYG